MDAAVIPAAAASLAADGNLLALWLHSRSPHTQSAYRADVRRLWAFCPKPLDQMTLADLQAFADTLSGAEATRYRALSAVKSLFAFAHRLGLCPLNVAAALKLPPRKVTLAERILEPAAVLNLIFAGAVTPRNRALLRLMYAAGARVSEVCALCWRDLQERDDAGQITVFGKGGKTRAILLSGETWRELVSLRNGAGPEDPVFRSRKQGRRLTRQQVREIVRQSARRAGIERNVSPHWLRHAHASHNLDRGTPIHLVQATLGHASVATTGRYLHVRPTDSSARHLGI